MQGETDRLHCIVVLYNYIIYSREATYRMQEAQAQAMQAKQCVKEERKQTRRKYAR